MYAESAERAVGYLHVRLLRTEWVTEHDDVAYYFKAPLVFAEAGDNEMAGTALDIAAKYAESGGASSKNSAYAGDYVHYPWMWLCWAAVRLEREELARNCWGRLYNFVHPVTCAGLVGAPYATSAGLSLSQRPLVGDIFATAEVAKAAMLLSRRGVAKQAGDTIVRALDANKAHLEAGKFFTRWASLGADGAEVHAAKSLELLLEDDIFHCLDQSSTGQLYSLLAFPVMVLLELSGTLGAVGFREAAMRMLEFLKGCSGVFESPMAHQVARAAAMAGDRETARRIADLLVSWQKQPGCFHDEPEAMDSVDQTAEIALWLLQLRQELEPPTQQAAPRTAEATEPRVAG